jgi:murein DD-endopeptidase MepM/ murein hydrolase activator NlpD
LSAREIEAFTDIFRHTVDFESDLRIGTRFELLFDEEGRSSKGDILYAKLINRENEIALYRGTDSVTGGAGYFDSAGRTNRRILLRNPVDGARVSSHFGVRKHPILGYKKMHKGVDFAAEHGTPVIAAGDGVVEVLGRKGGFGNYVRLRHSNGYGSAYAHLSKFAKTLKSGDRVRQGDVIGYVGNTGRSTGSHLHFEILRHGKQVDPLSTLELDSVRELTGPSFRNFIDRVSWIEIALARMRQG